MIIPAPVIFLQDSLGVRSCCRYIRHPHQLQNAVVVDAAVNGGPQHTQHAVVVRLRHSIMHERFPRLVAGKIFEYRDWRKFQAPGNIPVLSRKPTAQVTHNDERGRRSGQSVHEAGQAVELPRPTNGKLTGLFNRLCLPLVMPLDGRSKRDICNVAPPEPPMYQKRVPAQGTTASHLRGFSVQPLAHRKQRNVVYRDNAPRYTAHST